MSVSVIPLGSPERVGIVVVLRPTEWPALSHVGSGAGRMWGRRVEPIAWCGREWPRPAHLQRAGARALPSMYVIEAQCHPHQYWCVKGNEAPLTLRRKVARMPPYQKGKRVWSLAGSP
jgi:hypothetical protein